MKSKITLVVLALFSLTTYGQSRKTYSGEYQANGSGSQVSIEFNTGNATYTYYEDDEGNRLYDGSFRYDLTKNISNWDGSSTGDKVKVSIRGTYKDHLRHGDFTTTLSVTESGRTQTATCKTDYAMGYANGLWSVSGAGESKTVSFVNNVGNGNFNVQTNDLSITGKMNDKGLLDGDIVFVEGKWRTTITYDNGFELSYISKNTQTGEITEREETSEEQIAYFSQIWKAMQEQDTATLENIPYTFTYTRHYGIYNNYKSSFMDYNFPGATPGDLSAEQDYNHNYRWDAFGVIKLVEQETRDQRIAREKREEEERLAREAELKRQEEERLAREAAAKAEEERLAEERRMQDAIYDASSLVNQYPSLDAKIELELTDFTGVYFFTSKFLLAPYRVLRDSYVNDYNSMVNNFEMAYELQSNATKLVALCNKVLELMKLSKAENKELKLSLKGETDVETLERLFEIQ